MRALGILALICVLCVGAAAQSGALGAFTNQDSVGSPAIKGAAEFTGGEYRITGSGANMWGKDDQAEFVWREMTGNFTVSATMHFVGQGAEHRKAGIMVRQALGGDATYADVVIHGNGMPALQWRSKAGDETNTFDLPFDGPGTYRLKMVRTGVKVYMYVAKGDGEPKPIANTEVTFRSPVLVGLVVCSHQADAKDTAVFSNVIVTEQAAANAGSAAAPVAPAKAP